MSLPISLKNQRHLKRLDRCYNKTIRSFDKKLLKERRLLEKKGEKAVQIHQALFPLRENKYSELTILEDTIKVHITQSLLSETRRLFLTVPFDNEDEEMWGGFASVGERYLTNQGINLLKSLIREEKLSISRERNERMKSWFQLITILSGLVGTLTGFLAILYQFYKH
jgi:hypothetical protein